MPWMPSASSANVFVILAATERLDARAANRISEKLGGVPVLTSDQYNMYELVSILRACHMMASSRYHGIVTSMPALVPSAGITMDERIRNLMRERGHPDLLMTVDDPDLEPKLLVALETLATQGERIADGIARTVVKNLKVMARMGVYFEEEVQRRYPEFPDAHRRVELGRVSPAHERLASPVGGGLQLNSQILRYEKHAICRGNIFATQGRVGHQGAPGNPRRPSHGRDRAANLLELIGKARTFLLLEGLKKGDRCGLLAANSIRWIAMDLAAMAEGLIVVPLYFRQAPAELVAMMKDSTPLLVCCGDAKLRDGILQNWPGAGDFEAPSHFLFDEIFAGVEGITLDRPQVRDEDPGHDHLHVGHIGRGQGSGADGCERRIHAGLHVGAARLADGRPVRAGPHFSLPAVQFLRVLDCRADFSAARKPGDAEHRPDEDP